MTCPLAGISELAPAGEGPRISKLIPQVVERSRLPESIVRIVVHLFLAVISDELAMGHEIILPNCVIAYPNRF